MSYRRAPRKQQLSGSVQVGPARLEIVRECEPYPDGTRRWEYRIVAPVEPHWGNVPKPGAEWVHQHGIGPRTEEELRRDFAYQLENGGLYGYRGSVENFPYVRAS